ncbi:hypothetical protein RF11_13635 [Thelohanellus kitauei]|uniref:Uncharacterized protein n=1 Tax=Thelohanellus kitauei TaxID=669202 RepID=A0A0C2N552_THEKT|nr:hypothetical protein RF11_13635 [Thelohanellus kitauei]
MLMPTFQKLYTKLLIHRCFENTIYIQLNLLDFLEGSFQYLTLHNHHRKDKEPDVIKDNETFVCTIKLLISIANRKRIGNSIINYHYWTTSRFGVACSDFKQQIYDHRNELTTGQSHSIKEAQNMKFDFFTKNDETIWAESKQQTKFARDELAKSIVEEDSTSEN